MTAPKKTDFRISLIRPPDAHASELRDFITEAIARAVAQAGPEHPAALLDPKSVTVTRLLSMRRFRSVRIGDKKDRLR